MDRELITDLRAGDVERYAAWFCELDAWTEYWDVYHPETRGKYYFGDGHGGQGLLTRFLPREQRPPAFTAWCAMALGTGSTAAFEDAIHVPDVASAVIEVDTMVAGLFAKHFGGSCNETQQRDYLKAMLACAIDSLPPALDRDRRIRDDDWRKPTAGRHMIDNDLMWFAWALHLEASQLLSDDDQGPRRALQLAGIAVGCAANFAWRAHRRTRPEYRRGADTVQLLLDLGLAWASDHVAGRQEVHELFRIREWGHV